MGEATVLPIYMACTIGALLLSLVLSSSEATTRLLCATGAALLGAVVMVHAYIWAALITDEMAWGVSAVLLITVLALALRARASR
jgi:hypothetical protein